MCEICSKLTIKAPERRSVSIVKFEHVIAGWVSFYSIITNLQILTS